LPVLNALRALDALLAPPVLDSFTTASLAVPYPAYLAGLHGEAGWGILLILVENRG
jgi:hypothetical protein